MGIEEHFGAELRVAINACHALGYRPTRFTQMPDRMGARATAARLVVSGDMQTGFKELVERGHAELTMESIMLQPEFAELFTAAELAAARWRLQQAGITDPGRGLIQTWTKPSRNTTPNRCKREKTWQRSL